MAPDMADDGHRRQELATNLAQVRAEIEQACRDSGRDGSQVRLVAVTKHFPAADVCHLAALGISQVGENRDQEAAAKVAAVSAAGVNPDWHFVGRLQRNKCRSVAGYASLVQSVDRPALVTALSAATADRSSRLGVLLQLSVDGDLSRGGVAESEDERLAEQVMAAPTLELRGVMAVAPLDWDPRSAFEAVAKRAEAIRKLEPAATVISAGMSHDFPQAIACGSTMIRLGSKLLGPRPQVG